MSKYDCVVLDDSHSVALLNKASQEGIIPPARHGTRKASPTSITASQAVDAILLHKKVMLSGHRINEFDISNLHAEGILQGDPIEMDEAWVMGTEKLLKSPGFPQLAEQGILLDHFVLKNVWSNAYRFLKGGYPNLAKAVWRSRWTTRQHIWRLACCMLAGKDYEELHDYQKVAISESLMWWSENPDLWIKLYKGMAAVFAIGISVDVRFLTLQLEAASTQDACRLYDDRGLLFGHEKRLPRLSFVGNLQTDALATLRMVISGDAEGPNRTPSLRQAIKLRNTKQVIGLRQSIGHLVDGAIAGDKNIFEEASREVRKARNCMKWSAIFSHASRVITYLSLPVGVVELLCALPPVAGLTLGTASVSSQLTIDAIGKKHEWVVSIV